MYSITEYEQTAVYDPTDPTQRIREVYAPGGYTSLYWNKVPPTVTQLQGLGTGWAGIPSWAQIAIVAAGSIVAGYGLMSVAGDKYIKPGLRRIGINLSGLGRHHRRR